MGNPAHTKLTRADKIAARNQQLADTEGGFFVSFVFNGKKYERFHQHTASEIKHLKEIIRDHGPNVAVDQIAFRVPAGMCKMLTEEIFMRAAAEYGLIHYRPEEVPADAPLVPLDGCKPQLFVKKDPETSGD